MNLKETIYELGFRPKPGNPFHSRALSIIYAMEDCDFVGGTVRSMEESVGQVDAVVANIDKEVHKEPRCYAYNGCINMKEHYHGVACSTTCWECYGDCHYDCPANKDALNDE